MLPLHLKILSNRREEEAGVPIVCQTGEAYFFLIEGAVNVGPLRPVSEYLSGHSFFFRVHLLKPSCTLRCFPGLITALSACGSLLCKASQSYPDHTAT